MSARVRLFLLVLAPTVAGCGDPLADLNYRGPVVVAGRVTVSPTLSCKLGDPLYDCRGLLLFVALIDRPEPLPLSTMIASTSVANVDLNEGKAASYALQGVPAGGYYLSAMLAKSAVLSDPPFPRTGDLVHVPSPLEVKPGVVTEQDFELETRWK
jgi:hypothetical protein